MSGDNDYPNVDNYPEASFKTPIAPPDVEPDEGDLISVSYNPFWGQVLAAACMALLQPSTWQGTHDEIVLAQNRANTLLTLLQEPVSVSLVEAPFWDDANGDDAPDTATPDTQDWYGYMEGVNFVDTLAGWVFTAFVASTYGVEGAIQFATTLHNLRLFFRTADAGAIINVLMDGDVFAQVDTYSSTPGLTFVDIVSPGTTMQIVNTGTANPLATPVDGKYLMAVVRKQLTEAEVVSENIRYDTAAGTTQITPDGGTTWADAPQLDPRTSTVYLLPPLSGTGHECDGAARIVGLLQETLNTFLSSVSAAQFATIILGIILTLVGPVGWIISLLMEVFDALVVIGATNIQAAFTPEVWAHILCIVQCRLEPDGSLTAAGAALVLDDIDAQIGGTVAGTIHELMTLYGNVMLSNSVVERTETGDCGDCDPCSWAYFWDFRVSDGGWYQATDTDYPPYAGHWVSGAGWVADYTGHANGCGSIYTTNIQIAAFDLPSGTRITGMSFASRGYNCGHSELWAGASRGAGLAAGRLYWYNSGTVLDGVQYNASGAAIEGESGIHIEAGFSWNSAQQIYWVRIEGDGDKPALTGGEWV